MWSKRQIAKFVDEQPDDARSDDILRKLFFTIAIQRGLDKGTRKQALRDYEKAQFTEYLSDESGLYPVEWIPEYITESAFLDAATTSPDFINELTGAQINSTEDGTFAIVDVFASYIAMMCYRHGLSNKEIASVFNLLRHVGWHGIANNLRNGQTLLILRGNQAEFMHEHVTFKKMRELKDRPYPCICLDLLDFLAAFQDRLWEIPECQRKLEAQTKKFNE